MQTTVTISGMRSEHCKHAVFMALTPLEGIRSASVELGTVTVEHDGGVSVGALREAIAVAGYAVVSAREDRRVLPMMRAVEQQSPPQTSTQPEPEWNA